MLSSLRENLGLSAVSDHDTHYVTKKTLIDLIGLLLLALVVVVGYKLSPLLLPKADVTIQPDSPCDLQRMACVVRLPEGGAVTLSMTPRPIPMVKPFHVDVMTEGIAARRVDVDFAGVEMNMGLNRPRLQSQGEGRFGGEATLPVCVTGAMVWQVTLLLETDQARLAIPLRFNSAHE